MLLTNSLFTLFCFDENTDPAGGGGGSGGTGEPNPKTVDYGSYDKAVKEAKAAKQRAKEAEDRLRALDDEKKQRELDEAKKRGDFETQLKVEKERADAAAAKAAEAEKRAAEAAERELTRTKSVEFIKALGQVLDKKFYNLVDLDQIKIDEHGNVDQASLNKYVTSFRSEYGILLGKPGSTNFPDNKPKGEKGITGSGGPISIKDRDALKEQRESLRERVEAAKKKRGLNF